MNIIRVQAPCCPPPHSGMVRSLTPRCPWPSSKPWNPATTAFWLPLLEIIWINILRSGDNAVPGKQINEQKHSLEINGRRRQAHRDYEFMGQFLGINRANIDTWPKRPHFARHLVRGSSRDLPLDDWDHACAGHGSFCNCYRCTGFRGKCEPPAPVMRNSAPGRENSNCVCGPV